MLSTQVCKCWLFIPCAFCVDQCVVYETLRQVKNNVLIGLILR